MVVGRIFNMKLIINEIPGYRLYEIIYTKGDNVKDSMIGTTVTFNRSKMLEKVDINRPNSEHQMIIKNMKGLVGIK